MRSVLDEGRQAYVAVVTKAGPHVTPELYAAGRDDVWFLAAATTLKVRVAAANDRVGALVRTGGRAVLLSGPVRTYDVRRPADVARAVADPAVTKALTGYLLRNARDLAGFATDTLSGRLGRRPPPRRVLIRLHPTRAALIDGPAVTAAEGDWPGHAAAAGGATPPGDRDAVLGWLGPDGPVALPARAAGDAAYVAPAAAALAALPAEAPACLVTDDYGRPGPAAKTGTLWRGTGELHPDGRVSLTVERTTTWDGVETSTTRS
jgi:hypothetical protein